MPVSLEPHKTTLFFDIIIVRFQIYDRYLNESLGIALIALLMDVHTGAANEGPECVILLHGLARTEKSLLKIERYLKKMVFMS